MNIPSFDIQQFDAIPLSTDTVVLSTAAIQWATNICQDIPDGDGQWQSFLTALAVAGVDQWLGDTGLSSTYPRSMASAAAVTITVGDYRLCVLPLGGLIDEMVTIPVTAVMGEQAAHLYILAEVQEEVDQVRVVTGLRHDQLRRFLPTQSGAQQASPAVQGYDIPLPQFTVTPDQLLLYLNCLAPEAMNQPANPRPISEVVGTIATGVVNVGKWLQGELDTVAERLAWELLPPLTPAQEFRPIKEEIEDIVDELASQGIAIPQRARGAFKAVDLAGFPCRLYAWAWPLMTDDLPEWSLFLILGPTPGATLPLGLELKVSDQQEPLSRSVLTQETTVTYLYAQAIGYWQEKFLVDIGLPNGPTVNLPPFSFEPES